MVSKAPHIRQQGRGVARPSRHHLGFPGESHWRTELSIVLGWFLFVWVFGMWKFPGQGSNLCHSSHNTRSLTHWPQGKSWNEHCCASWQQGGSRPEMHPQSLELQVWPQSCAPLVSILCPRSSRLLNSRMELITLPRFSGSDSLSPAGGVAVQWLPQISMLCRQTQGTREGSGEGTRVFYNQGNSFYFTHARHSAQTACSTDIHWDLLY